MVAVNSESTEHMRLRLHKLVEDYIATANIAQNNNHKFIAKPRVCPNGKALLYFWEQC